MTNTKCARCEYGDWHRHSGKECKACGGSFKKFKEMVVPRSVESAKWEKVKKDLKALNE